MSLKKAFVLTFGGEGVPVARKLQAEGVEVLIGQIKDSKCLLTDDEEYKPEDPTDKERRLRLGTDLTLMDSRELVKRALAEKDKESCFFLADFNNCFDGLDEIRASRMPGLYPTKEDRTMEVDRRKAKEFVEKNYPDLEVAEVEELKTVEEAEKFLSDTDAVWVLKGYDIDAPTFVPTSDDPQAAAEEVKKQLTKFKEAYEKSEFELERKIINPVEITPQAIFNDGKFLGAIACIEAKRAGARETGEMTGCAGDLVFPIGETSELFKMAFPKAVYALAKKHKGVYYADASILFDKQGTPYFGEHCYNRPGYDCLYTEIEMVGSARKYFEAIMEDKNPYADAEWGFGFSVRLMNATGGSPDKKPKKAAQNVPVEGEMWGMDIVDGKTAGYSWETGVVTGGGNSPEHAAKRAINEACMVDFTGKHYRKDLGASDYPQAILRRYKWGKSRGLY